MGHLQASATASIGFFDAASKRAFGADRDAVGGGDHMPDQQAGGEDQFVVRAERLASRVDFVQQDAGREAAPAQTLPACGKGSRFRVRVRMLMRQVCKEYGSPVGMDGSCSDADF